MHSLKLTEPLKFWKQVIPSRISSSNHLFWRAPNVVAGRVFLDTWCMDRVHENLSDFQGSYFIHTEICMQQEPRSLLHEDVEGVWPKIQLISKIQTLPYLDKFGRGCQQEGFAFAKFCCATQGDLMYRNLEKNKQYILPENIRWEFEMAGLQKSWNPFSYPYHP